MVNLLQLNPGEHVSAVIPVKEYNENKNIFIVTKKGIVKKTSIMEYAHIRKTGIIGINLRDDDELIEVKQTDADTEIFLVTKYGKCIRFKETDVRTTGRSAMGVIGMTLNYDDEVVGMQLDHQGDSLLIVSANGMGKRTSTDEYSVQNRGGKGVKCYKVTDKTGDIIGVKAVNDDHEIMMITSTGIIIQIKMSDLRLIGRDTSGVKLIDLEDGVTVAQIAKVREKVSDGVSEFDNVDDALEDIPEQEIIDDDFDEDEDMIFPKEEDEDE